ncbi:hypothetical protein ABID37_005244, partial [Aquamicrobium terrae]
MIAVARPAGRHKGCASAAPAGDGFRHRDPVLALADRWRDAHARALALCRRQQRLESRIARTTGSLPTSCSEEVLGPARRTRGDLDLGYSKAKAAEERFAGETARLLEELARTPAHS